ncbi:hypothetical protein [Chroococcidiopsis sp.]|uniref:hypothetical protein n=1 Tax=Chroococcidiopsis sp. TaxID=3088168 RepID=UPI003F30993F
MAGFLTAAGGAAAGANTLLQQGANLLSSGATAKQIFDHFTGGGYGGTNMNAGNIGTVQGQTPYDPAQMIGVSQNASNQDLNNLGTLGDRMFYRNEAANDARRQANLVNDVAIGDMANRANAAANVLNSYNQARQTNANFLANLQAAGLTQR